MSERRLSARHRFANPFSLPLLAADGGLVGVAAPEDVSTSGIRLLVGRPCAVGEVLAVGLVPPHPLGQRSLTFRVVRCEPTVGGARVAGPFLSPLSEAEVLAMAGA